MNCLDANFGWQVFICGPNSYVFKLAKVEIKFLWLGSTLYQSLIWDCMIDSY